jgi:hypothetical protein
MALPTDPRELALLALESNPVIVLAPDTAHHLAQGGDISFDALDIDSLARMELSIWLEINCALVLTEAEIGELGSFQQLVERLALSARP